MSREPRFEIVRSEADQPWHARYIAANGRMIWWTESYARKYAAENAIEALAGRFIRRTSWGSEVYWAANREAQLIEVRYVDDRLVPKTRPSLPEPGEVAS